MEIIKYIDPAFAGFRGKFDENSRPSAKGFVHHEKQTFAENCKESQRLEGMDVARGERLTARGGGELTLLLRCLNGG